MIAALRRALVGEGELTYRQGAITVLRPGSCSASPPCFFERLEGANDWQFLVIRGGSTASRVAGCCVYSPQEAACPLRSDNLDHRFAGLLLASMSLLYILALARTTAALTTFFLAAAPFSGAFFGRVVLAEKVSMVTVTAMGAAAVGVAIMVGSGIDAGQTSGVVLAALIPIILGLYNVLIRSSGSSVDPVLPAIIAGLALVVVAGIVSVATVGLAMSMRDILLGFASGGVILGIGLPLFNVGHRSVPTAQVSLVILTEIVLTPVWVWIWPGEIPTTGTLIGGAVVLAAVVYLIVASDREMRMIVPTI